MKIFLCCTSFRAQYGGPAFSVSGLAKALSRAGIKVGVWAPDGSSVHSEVFRDFSGVDKFGGSAEEALTNFGNPDVLHDNGIWLAHNHRLATLARASHIRRLVSLRGMLEPWSLSHRKWKKKLALGLYQKVDLTDAACHHATSEMEAENIKRLRLGVPICVIPNGVDIPAITRAPKEQLSKPKIALFLSRIHPKKGLPLLISAWEIVQPVGWILRIVGPDEEGHRAEIEKTVAERGLGSVIELSGPLTGKQKESAYLESALFVLPTHSENFGIVVAEALAFGLPVITTTGTPWQQVESQRCGWFVETSVSAIASALREATSLSPHHLAQMGQRGREWVSAQFAWERIANDFIALYEDMTNST